MIFQAVIVAFAIVMISAWIFGVVEIVSVSCFARWAYMCGKRVMYELLPADIPYPLPVGRSGETANGKFVVHAPDSVLIRRKLKLLGFQNALTFKLVLRLDQKGMIVDARLPIGPLVFIMGWLLGWLVGSLSFVPHDPAVSVLMAGGGSLFVGLMVGTSLLNEKRRARTLAAEVIAQLSLMRT